METQVERLADLGEAAVQVAIDDYTRWFVIASLCWLALALACVAASGFAWRASQRSEFFKEELAVVSFVLLAIAAVSVCLNVPTLLEPRAYAIHQLVTDAT